MKLIIMRTVTFILLMLMFDQSSVAASPIRILAPASDCVSVVDRYQLIVGTVDTTQIDSLILVVPFSDSTAIERTPYSFNTEFASKIKAVLPDNIELTYFAYTTFNANQKMISQGNKEYLPSEHMSLRSFWSSSFFKKLYSTVVIDSTNVKKISVWTRGSLITMKGINSAKYRAKYKNFFKFRIKLDPGVTEIRIQGTLQKGDGKVDVPVSIYLANPLDSKTRAPNGFAYRIFHTSTNESACNSCHKFELSPTAGSPQTVGQSCLICHRFMLDDKYVHGPVSQGKCMVCHSRQTTGDTNGYVVAGKSSMDKLCYKCHSSMQDANRTKKFIHGPADAGECLLCHELHHSKFNGQLSQKANLICSTCHEGQVKIDHPVVAHPLQGKADPLNRSNELSCVSCHSPHNSDHPKLFYRAENQFQLCIECHQK